MARPTLATHPKFAKLAHRLHGRAVARGVLELIWESCYASGEAVVGDAEAVEAISDWRGAPGELAGALEQCGFLDVLQSDANGGRLHYAVHDLEDHAPDYVLKRWEREAKRKAAGETIRSVRQGAARRRWESVQTDANVRRLQDNGEHVSTRVIPPAPAPAPITDPDLEKGRDPGAPRAPAIARPPTRSPPDAVAATDTDRTGVNGTGLAVNAIPVGVNAQPSTVNAAPPDDPKRPRTAHGLLALFGRRWEHFEKKPWFAQQWDARDADQLVEAIRGRCPAGPERDDAFEDVIACVDTFLRLDTPVYAGHRFAQFVKELPLLRTGTARRESTSPYCEPHRKYPRRKGVPPVAGCAWCRHHRAAAARRESSPTDIGEVLAKRAAEIESAAERQRQADAEKFAREKARDQQTETPTERTSP
jgi:hypothetical protein